MNKEDIKKVIANLDYKEKEKYVIDCHDYGQNYMDDVLNNIRDFKNFKDSKNYTQDDFLDDYNDFSDNLQKALLFSHVNDAKRESLTDNLKKLVKNKDFQKAEEELLSAIGECDEFYNEALDSLAKDVVVGTLFSSTAADCDKEEFPLEYEVSKKIDRDDIDTYDLLDTRYGKKGVDKFIDYVKEYNDNFDQDLDYYADILESNIFESGSIKLSNIDWDLGVLTNLSNKEIESIYSSLPKGLLVPTKDIPDLNRNMNKDEITSVLNDFLSDTYGYSDNGYDFAFMRKEELEKQKDNDKEVNL